MSKAPIKLFEIESVEFDGKTTRRFQSQLLFLKKADSADFIIEEDGKIYNWGYGDKGEAKFHPFNDPYEIVKDIEEMRVQQL